MCGAIVARAPPPAALDVGVDLALEVEFDLPTTNDQRLTVMLSAAASAGIRSNVQKIADYVQPRATCTIARFEVKK